MVTINDGYPSCIKFMSNNHQYASSALKLAYRITDKIGLEKKEEAFAYVVACTNKGMRRPDDLEKVGADYDCRLFAVKNFDMDMTKKGCDLCLSCPVYCGDMKNAADFEEKQFISYLFRTEEGRARQILDIVEPSAFKHFVTLGNEMNTFTYPMCVPLASMIVDIAKGRTELFVKVYDLVKSVNKRDGKGSIISKNVTLPIVEEYVDEIIDRIVSYCENEDIRGYLSEIASRKVLWKAVCKSYLCIRSMNDDEAKEFIAERFVNAAEEAVYVTPGEEFGVIESGEPSLFEGCGADMDSYEEAFAEREAEEEIFYVGHGESAASDKSVYSSNETGAIEELGEVLIDETGEVAEIDASGMEVPKEVYAHLLEEREQLLKKNEELVRVNKEVLYRASHDELTGLFNRTAYSDELKNIHSSVVFFDINNLKYVNDISGDHEKGDKLIKVVASSIADAFGSELAFRTGGDEFVVFADELNVDEIKARIVGIKKELQEFTESGTEGIVYSVSAGYAFVQNGESLAETIQRADEHMKRDKKRYKKEHPELDARNIKGIKEEYEKSEEEKPVYRPQGSIEEHPYFTRKVEMTEGGFLTVNDKVRRVPMRNRRYIIPFAENDYSLSPDRNVIVHHEIESSDLLPYRENGEKRRVFEVKTCSDDKEIESELDHLKANAKNSRMVACEVAYVTDQERYVLLMWNVSNNRLDYFELINKKDGAMKPMPRQIIDILKSEGIKKVCYQPYLLCAMMGLYIREVEIKNVHSIFSEYHVFNSQLKGVEWAFDAIMRSYTALPSEKLKKTLAYKDKEFGSSPMFMGMMMIYKEIATMQLSYSKEFGYDALCASRHRKDLMYGYSYLAAGIFPSMQKAMFKLTPSGQYIFFNKPEPAVSYFEGYVVQYMFRNINAEPGDRGEVREANEKSNVRARQLLLKDLATIGKGFYHTNLKILYFDEYYMIFYMAHNYLVQNQQFIETALKRECTKHKIVTDQFLYSCWATTFDMVRLVNKH